MRFLKEVIYAMTPLFVPFLLAASVLCLTKTVFSKGAARCYPSGSEESIACNGAVPIYTNKVWLLLFESKREVFHEVTLSTMDNSLILPNDDTYLVKVGDANIIVNPYFPTDTFVQYSMLSGQIIQEKKSLEDLPEIDIIIISECYSDYLDNDFLSELKRRYSPVIITRIGNGDRINTNGYFRIYELALWEEIQLANNLSISISPSYYPLFPDKF